MTSCAGDCALKRATTGTLGSSADPSNSPTSLGSAASEGSAGAAGSSRREFLSHALLVSVGTFLAACGDGNIGGVTGSNGSLGTTPPPPAGGPLVVTLADLPALASNGGIARVDGATRVPIAVTRVDASTYLAFSMICPHARFRPIEIVPGFGFACPNHGSAFASDGRVVIGPATSNLRTYGVVLNAGAGTLTIG